MRRYFLTILLYVLTVVVFVCAIFTKIDLAKQEIIDEVEKMTKPKILTVVEKQEVEQPKELKPVVIETKTEEEPKEITHAVESLGEFKLTAYCSCSVCCEGWANSRPLDENGNEVVYGASGRVLTAGKSIAVDPTIIPFGTTVYINGIEYVAEDCGGAIKGNRIDVYFSNHADALEFGTQYVEVFV